MKRERHADPSGGFLHQGGPSASYYVFEHSATQPDLQHWSMPTLLTKEGGKGWKPKEKALIDYLQEYIRKTAQSQALFCLQIEHLFNTLKVHSIQPQGKPIYKEISQFFGSNFNLIYERVPSMYGSPYFMCYNIMLTNAEAHLSPSPHHFYYSSDSDNYGYPSNWKDLCKEAWWVVFHV